MTTQLAIPGFGIDPMSTCRVCDRVLTNPVSVRAGVGPVCRKRLGIQVEPERKDDSEMAVVTQAYPTGHDIVCRRTPDGDATVSIPKRHRHHDTTESFEWGYGGSGPADLALNILALYLPGSDVTLWDKSTVSRAAWELHQAFKRTVIEAIDFDGNTITDALIREWLARYERAV